MQIRNHNLEQKPNISYPVENSREDPARRPALEASADLLSPKILDDSSIISEKLRCPQGPARGLTARGPRRLTVVAPSEV
jgi:hypothetical protein